jgi:hypothetical protein
MSGIALKTRAIAPRPALDAHHAEQRPRVVLSDRAIDLLAGLLVDHLEKEYETKRRRATTEN